MSDNTNSSSSTPTTPVDAGNTKKFSVRVRANISKEPVAPKQQNNNTKKTIRRPSQPQSDNSPISSTSVASTIQSPVVTSQSSDTSISSPTTPTTTTGGNRRDSLIRKSTGSSLVGSPTERIIANALQQQKRTSLNGLINTPTSATVKDPFPSITTSSQQDVDNNTISDTTATNTSTNTATNTTPVVTTTNTTNANANNNTNNNTNTNTNNTNNNNKRTIPISKKITKKEPQHHQMSPEEQELSLSNFTLPMLPQDQQQALYNTSDDDLFVFYIQNPIFDSKEAIDPQITMNSSDIETYNAVLKRIENNNKDKNNHLVFEYEMASYLAHKHVLRKTTLTRRLSHGSMAPRPREKKPLDEIFHDEHDISRCSKNWKFQIRVFNENNGFIDPEYEIPASLITSSFKWKHEFMSQQLAV